MQENVLNDHSFPQFSAASGNTRKAGEYENGMDFYRFDPAVQNCAGAVLRCEHEPFGMCFTLSVNARKAVLSYTHETSLFLYKPANATKQALYLHILFQSDSIFRVIFSDKREIENPFSGIPEEGRMLIAKPHAVSFDFSEEEDFYALRTSEITIRIEKGTSKITAYTKSGVCFFSQYKQLFRTGDIHDLAVSETNGSHAVFEALTLESDEVIYGLGERFDSLTRNGRTVDLYNKDAVGTTSRRSYLNIPFYISTAGYGLFLNAGAQVDFQIGTRDSAALQFAVKDRQLDYFVIAGSTPKEILSGYCSLTGFSKLPPVWSFGLWLSRNSYVSWDVVNDVAEKAHENKVLADVLHLDTAWFNRDWNCDLKFSEERFPNPEENMARLLKSGYRVSLWQYNFIPPNDDNTHYHEAAERGYLSKDASGKPYQLPESCNGSWTKDVTIDFSNPDACKWYADKIERLIQMGACAIKTDFGEGIAEDALYRNIDGRHFHNLYSLLYNSVVFNATKKASGENIVWARSGTAGSQRYPLHWGDDSQCTFEALASTLRGALSVGISGIPFFSHDIGGFLGTPTDELYVRWAQVGLFSSHARCHGVGDHNYREPWRFSEKALEIFRFYNRLRYSLMPYIYAEAEKCTRTGLPMMRALWLEYPSDRNVRHIDDEYLFGDSLLIAPVLKPLSKSNVRHIYLPEGTWFDYFTKEKFVSNGMWICMNVSLETLPIFVKEGARLSYRSAETNLSGGMGEIIRTEEWV